LLVTRNGSTALAADPERAALFLVDLKTLGVREVHVEAGDELGRVVEGADGVAYVLARRGGALLVVDLAQGAITRRVPVCAAPRGVAFDPATGVVHVACRSGQLVTFDAGTFARTRVLQLDPDLRDVLVRGSELVLTRFRSAELLVLDAQGKLLRRATPAPQPGCASATVAYRAVLAQNGEVLVAHQSSSDDAVGISSSAYGFSCGGSLVNAFVTRASVGQAVTRVPGEEPHDGVDNPIATIALRSQQMFNLATGPLDVAVSSNGQVAVLANGIGALGAASLGFGTLTDDARGLAISSPSPMRIPGEPVAVAFDAADGFVVQSREPAQLVLADGRIVPLSADSRLDTGHQMFHLNTGLGIACASCHPEGDEDGHLWHFSFGLRRTQPLQGGVLSRAPFHWNGELATMTDLVSEVMIKRMGLQQAPSFDQVGALASWLDGLQAERNVDALDPAAVSRGTELFREPSIGCAACHSGPQFTDNQAHDVGTGGPFSTPTLLGVGLRSPLFHDGCAPAIDARFGICGGGDQHGTTSGLSEEERQDLLAYLKSL
jgi:DNA-binding beta-propeller fold protein YncE